MAESDVLPARELLFELLYELTETTDDWRRWETLRWLLEPDGGHRVVLASHMRERLGEAAEVWRDDWGAERLVLTRELAELLESVAPSKEVGLASYVNPKQPGKRMRLSWAKLFRKVQHLLKGVFVIEDADIELWQAALTTRLKDFDYTFELVEGGAVSDTYYAEYFGSCMHQSPAVRFYDENPEVVKLLRIIQGGRLKGRALVWTLTDGSRFLDRVYPSDGGSHIHAAWRYAQEQGWYYRTTYGAVAEWEGPEDMRVRVRDVNAYPYMDTFARVMSVPDEDDYFELQATGEEREPDAVYLFGTNGASPWARFPAGQTWNGTRYSRQHLEAGDVEWLDVLSGYAWSSDVVTLDDGSRHDRTHPDVEMYIGEDGLGHFTTVLPPGLVQATFDVGSPHAYYLWVHESCTVWVPELAQRLVIRNEAHAFDVAEHIERELELTVGRPWRNDFTRHGRYHITRTENGWEGTGYRFDEDEASSAPDSDTFDSDATAQQLRAAIDGYLNVSSQFWSGPIAAWPQRAVRQGRCWRYHVSDEELAGGDLTLDDIVEAHIEQVRHLHPEVGALRADIRRDVTTGTTAITLGEIV